MSGLAEQAEALRLGEGFPRASLHRRVSRPCRGKRHLQLAQAAPNRCPGVPRLTLQVSSGRWPRRLVSPGPPVRIPPAGVRSMGLVPRAPPVESAAQPISDAPLPPFWQSLCAAWRTCLRHVLPAGFIAPCLPTKGVGRRRHQVQRAPRRGRGQQCLPTPARLGTPSAER
jgi:hypothetical protein